MQRVYLKGDRVLEKVTRVSIPINTLDTTKLIKLNDEIKLRAFFVANTAPPLFILFFFSKRSKYIVLFFNPIRAGGGVI